MLLLLLLFCVGNRAHIADTVSRLAALPTQLAGSAPGAREYILAFVMLSQDVCVVLLLLEIIVIL
jgi:hypothetical protein